MPKVLITGVAGFIGMHTAIRFINEGWSVIGVDNINEYYSTDLKRDRIGEIRKLAEKVKQEFRFLEYDINSNKVSANFLLLDFKNCEFKAKNFYEKLKTKGIILRSTEKGYKIKNMLRLTIGSRTDNFKFMKAVKRIFNK